VDGNVLWLKIKEDEVKSKYERQIVPDPSRYYVKDYPYHHTITFPELKIIPPPKYERPSRKACYYSTAADHNRQYRCALCEKLFKTKDELSNHVAADH
jgi:hypothetical protein